MKKLLWIGDSCCHTGFGTVSREVLRRLSDRWGVSVLGINYYGDPHNEPYDVYPAMRDGDPYGVYRVEEVCAKVRPDVIVVNHDTWNVCRFVGKDLGAPVVGYMPIDGPHVCGDVARALNRLALAIWYTSYGMAEAERCGYTGKSRIIPHGIDMELYRPWDRKAARAMLGLPVEPGSVVIGNVNANRFRKRLDITLDVWRRVLDLWPASLPEPTFYLHTQSENDFDGWIISELMAYYKVGKVLLPAGVSATDGFPEERMALVYSALDVQMSTTMGEGWGLTTMEGLACGTMQVVPDFAALPEWLDDVDPQQSRHRLVPCGEYLSYPGAYNNVGREPDRDAMANAIVEAAVNQTQTQSKVDFEGYSWSDVADRFHEALSSVASRD